MQVVRNVPILFLFCLVIAGTNLAVTSAIGRLFRLNLEELLLSVNATLGGAPSAAAMAISRGWSNLVLRGYVDLGLRHRRAARNPRGRGPEQWP